MGFFWDKRWLRMREGAWRRREGDEREKQPIQRGWGEQTLTCAHTVSMATCDVKKGEVAVKCFGPNFDLIQAQLRIRCMILSIVLPHTVYLSINGKDQHIWERNPGPSLGSLALIFSQIWKVVVQSFSLIQDYHIWRAVEVWKVSLENPTRPMCFPKLYSF